MKRADEKIGGRWAKIEPGGDGVPVCFLDIPTLIRRSPIIVYILALTLSKSDSLSAGR